MNPALILLPVFAQVALTFVLLYRMGGARVAVVASGQVKVKDVVLGQSAWPDKVQQLGRSYQNQFELPMLFYALVALLLVTSHVDIFMLVLAWAFVALRVAHAYVHSTSNAIRYRFNLFAAGFVVLAIMWAAFAARVIPSLTI